MFIYLITNSVTDKYYVGKTTSSDLPKYLLRKTNDALSGHSFCPHLYNAIRKYGRDKFSIHPLMSTLTSNSELLRWEMELIALFKSRDPKIGYNVTPGGDGAQPGELNSFYGKKHSAETKKKLSELRTGTTMSDETRKKIGRTHKVKGIHPPSWGGKTHSEETKNKISGAHRGKELSPEHREVFVQSRRFRGREHTEATRERMRAAQALRRSDEARQKAVLND